MASRKVKANKEPSNAREAFKDYARATYREMDLRKVLNDWQKANPGGVPGEMVVMWAEAVQARVSATKKLHEFTKGAGSPDSPPAHVGRGVAPEDHRPT